jgi:hypothetical protein
VGAEEARLGRVTRAGIEAENERLRDQHRQEHFRTRASTYHAFLNADLLLQTRLAYEAEVLSRDEYDQWSRQFLDLLTGVVLFGTEAAQVTAELLLKAHQNVFTGFMQDTSQRSFGEKMRDAYQAQYGAILISRQACERATREDVAPR